MTYTVEQLASGSYDVLLNGALVAALVQGIDGFDDGWRIDLLDEAPLSDRPAPFTTSCHTFRSLAAALDWLGIRRGATVLKLGG